MSGYIPVHVLYCAKLNKQKAWLTARPASKDSVTFAFCERRPVSKTSVDPRRVSGQALNQTICLNRALCKVLPQTLRFH